MEPYNRHQRNRYTCPSCGKHREFTRYIDTKGAISFPEYVGKCNRINNCGYHYTPAMYFDEHPECKEYNKSFPIVKDKKPVVCHPRLPPVHRHTDTSFIPDEIMQQTMKCYEQNNLFLYLTNHLGYESALRLMKTYHVGTARKWKNDFGKIVNYTMKGNNKSKLLATEGVRSDSKQHIAESFSCQAGLNTRIRTPVYHISLSFSKQDSGKLTDDLMVKIAGEYMEKMNIKNTQYIVVRHYDREHPHIHLVINRVDNDGKTISDSNDRIRNNRVCRELTIKYGLYMPKGKENVKYDRLRGKDKHKYEMMFAIRKALEKSNNWNEFKKKLSRDKIHFTIRTDSKGKPCGIVFSRGEYTFSGSRIDRSLSYFKIANMLNKYENSLDKSDCLGNTQQDKIQEQEKDTVTPTEHEGIYEDDVTSPIGNSIINAVADLLLQPNAVISSRGGGGNSNQLDDDERKRKNREHIRSRRR